MPFFKDFAESTVYGHSHGADAMIPWWGHASEKGLTISILLEYSFFILASAWSTQPQPQVHVLCWLWFPVEPAQLRQPVHQPRKHHLVLCGLPKHWLLGDHHSCHPLHSITLCCPAPPVCGCRWTLSSNAVLLNWIYSVKEPLQNSSSIVRGATSCNLVIQVLEFAFFYSFLFSFSDIGCR